VQGYKAFFDKRDRSFFFRCYTKSALYKSPFPFFALVGQIAEKGGIQPGFGIV
jgi:hypothetical protein